jgi:hypothetical protein
MFIQIYETIMPASIVMNLAARTVEGFVLKQNSNLIILLCNKFILLKISCNLLPSSIPPPS